MKTSKSRNNQNGFSLVEAVIVASITSAFIIALSQVNGRYLSYAFAQGEVIQANYLLEGGIEAAKFMRDQSFGSNISPLNTATNYYTYWNNNSWKSTTTPQNNNGFFRTTNFAQVYRDANDNIASSGTLDSGTKLVTVSVSWSNKGATTTKTLQGYITNVFNN